LKTAARIRSRASPRTGSSTRWHRNDVVAIGATGFEPATFRPPVDEAGVSMRPGASDGFILSRAVDFPGQIGRISRYHAGTTACGTGADRGRDSLSRYDARSVERVRPPISRVGRCQLLVDAFRSPWS
jgi:hypothetical protein